jgi:hypothetical protein
MDRNDFISEWAQAADSGTLLTPKHDPANLNITWSKYRSVLSSELSGNLSNFIKSGEYSIQRYHDANYSNGSGYFALTPNSGSPFSVPGSGVPSGSITPTAALDRLILVYGPVQHWHVYAESSSFISGAKASGRLTESGSF